MKLKYKWHSYRDVYELEVEVPDEDVDMCRECSHMNSSAIFTGVCDLGIKIH